MSSFHIAATRVSSFQRRRLSGIFGSTIESREGLRRPQHGMQHLNQLREMEKYALSITKRMSSTLSNQWQIRKKQLVPSRISTFLKQPDRFQFQQSFRIQNRTMMARSSVHNDNEDPSQDPEAKAMTFLVGTLGHEKDVAKGVLDALKQSGISGGPALLAMVRSLAGRWEVDEDAGLEALVESVTVELARSKGKKTVSVWILPANAWASKEGDDDNEVKDDFKRAFKVEGFEDMSLTDVAKFGDGNGADILGEMIECACSGIMACSTCHVVVHPDWFEKVGQPTESELDMIDLAYNAQETSRLGCQVILKPELENAIFKIPRGANNMMDFIPFEDE